METPKSSILQIVESSALSQEQKTLWDDVLEKMDDEKAQVILESLADSPENLEYFTQNIQSKITALQNNDKQTWKKIIEDEKNKISSLQQG